jgi:hypothetical protein
MDPTENLMKATAPCPENCTETRIHKFCIQFILVQWKLISFTCMEYENNLTKNYIPFIVPFPPLPHIKIRANVMVRCVSLMLCLHRKGFGSTFKFSDCISSSNLQKSSAVLPGMCRFLPAEKLTRLLSCLTTA